MRRTLVNVRTRIREIVAIHVPHRSRARVVGMFVSLLVIATLSATAARIITGDLGRGDSASGQIRVGVVFKDGQPFQIVDLDAPRIKIPSLPPQYSEYEVRTSETMLEWRTKEQRTPVGKEWTVELERIKVGTTEPSDTGGNAVCLFIIDHFSELGFPAEWAPPYSAIEKGSVVVWDTKSWSRISARAIVEPSFICLGIGVIGIGAISWLSSKKRAAELDRCFRCGYDRSDLVSSICPECGSPQGASI